MRWNGSVAACVFAIILALTGNQAKANSVSFSADGFWSDQFHDVIPLVASITVDTNSGLVSNASFKLNSPAFGFETFTNIVSQGPNLHAPYFDLALQSAPVNSKADSLFITLSKNPSMAAADLSWMIVSGTANLIDGFCCVNLMSGTTLSAVSAVPLPAAFPLFASGLGAIGLLLLRRNRRVVVSPTA